MYICIYVYMYIYICIYDYMYICIYVYMYIGIYIYMHRQHSILDGVPSMITVDLRFANP